MSLKVALSVQQEQESSYRQPKNNAEAVVHAFHWSTAALNADTPFLIRPVKCLCPYFGLFR